MKRKFVSSLLLMLFISSILAFSNTSVVEAAPCNPGNYAKFDDQVLLNNRDMEGIKSVTFVCSGVNGNNSTSSGNADADAKYGVNGLNFEGENGAGWARNFFTFLIQLSVVVGYLSEVVAMLVIAYAAYLYTTSEGEPRKLRMAKMYVLYAFAGMFIGAFSLIIAKFIGGAL